MRQDGLADLISASIGINMKSYSAWGEDSHKNKPKVRWYFRLIFVKRFLGACSSRPA